ncbi:hypothetical protein H6503_04885 [Candidatus Woesearchaeota archaeon]|nr:hypothetical protein [Candidatus Woesearchaeota archaeon]
MASLLYLSGLEQGEAYVIDFCRRYQVSMIDRTDTFENGRKEPCWAFSDGTGYYTIEGMRRSLQPLSSINDSIE